MLRLTRNNVFGVVKKAGDCRLFCFRKALLVKWVCSWYHGGVDWLRRYCKGELSWMDILLLIKLRLVVLRNM